MSVRWIQPGASIDAQRGQVVVCIPVFGAHEQFVRCLFSVLDHTPADIKILICDDASPDARSQDFVRKLDEERSRERQIFYARQERNVGFPLNVNSGFAAAAPADVAVLNSDCAVAEGWLEGLRDAAHSDSRVATATALTNHGTLVSVPDRRPQAQLPQEWNLDDAAAAVREHSLRIRPRIPTAVGHCVYIRRSALELVGDFDPAFTPGYGEEVDFSQRCLRSGLTHVVADDVLVFHEGAGSFAGQARYSTTQARHERMLAARYPYYHEAVRALETDFSGPLARSLSAARRALKGLHVAIDARILSGATTGTQMHALELIAALARTEQVRITAIVPEKLNPWAALALESLDQVELITRAEAGPLRRNPADVIHRPFQISMEEDLVFLGKVGERLIITNQDLIGYHNPTYFKNAEAWQDYRCTTRAALSVADRVVFFSTHARDDALNEDLLEPSRASVIHIGVDHKFCGSTTSSEPPRGASRLPDDAEAILCIGTDFRHKNRVFALQILEQLQARHDWSGYLLLAGPTVAQGSSSPDEAQMLALKPRMAGAVLEFAAVSEAEKAWLFRRARLALYPTVHEGFGLVPFESADYGVPCLWAPGTALSEVLPDPAAAIVPWNAAETADAAHRLMRDETARQRNLEAIRRSAVGLTWDATAAHLVELYRQTCDAASAPTGAVERKSGLLTGTLSEDAIRLIGPGGALPSDVERPLLALATHRQFATPMFGVMKVGYRASYRLRRRLRRNGKSN